MFIVKGSHHNPIITPDKDHYWEAFATFNMSVVEKGKCFMEYIGLFLRRTRCVTQNKSRLLANR